MPELSKREYPKKEELECPECGGRMALKGSKHGPFYGCRNWPSCDCTHGAHPNGAPLGIPDDKETRRWRQKVHELFDPLWKEHDRDRDEAYALLADLMDLSRAQAHISRFDSLECRHAIAVLAEYHINELNRG